MKISPDRDFPLGFFLSDSPYVAREETKQIENDAERRRKIFRSDLFLVCEIKSVSKTHARGEIRIKFGIRDGRNRQRLIFDRKI